MKNNPLEQHLPTSKIEFGVGSEKEIGEPKLLKFTDDGRANKIMVTSDEDFGRLVGKEKVHNSSMTRASNLKREKHPREG